MLDEYHLYKIENKWKSKEDIEKEIQRRVEEKVNPLIDEIEKLEKQQNIKQQGVA
jgi:hypothetical protein